MDSVSIDGIGGGLPKWATEVTARGILDKIKSVDKSMDKVVKAIESMASSGGALGESVDDLEDALNDLEKSTNKQRGAVDKSSDSLDDLSESASSASANLGSLGTFVVDTAKKTANILVEANTNLLKMNSAGMNLISTIPGIASGIGVMADSMKTANLTYEEINSLQKEYGSVLATYGIQQFSRTTRFLTDALRDYGVTSTEAAQWTADYLDMQRAFGLRQNIQNEEDRKRMENIFTEFDKWGKTLGVSRAQMLRTMKESGETVLAKMFVARMGETGVKMQAEVNKVTASIPGLGAKLIESFAVPWTAASNEYQALLRAGGSEVAKTYLDVSEKFKAGTLAASDVETLIHQIGKLSESQLAYIQASVGNSDMMKIITDARTASIQLTESQKNVGKTADESSKKQLKASAEGTDAVKRLSNAITVAMASVYENEERAIELSNSISTAANALTDGIEAAYDRMTDAAGIAMDGVLKIFSAENIDAVVDKIGELGTSLGNLIDFLNKNTNNIAGNLLTLVGGLGAAYVGGKVVKGGFSKKGGAAGKVTTAATSATTNAGVKGALKSGASKALKFAGNLAKRGFVISGIFNAINESLNGVSEEIEKGSDGAVVTLTGISKASRGFFEGIAGFADFITGDALGIEEKLSSAIDASSSIADKIGSAIGETIFNFFDTTDEMMKATSYVDAEVSKISSREGKLKKINDHISYLKREQENSFFGLGDLEEELLKAWENKRAAIMKSGGTGTTIKVPTRSIEPPVPEEAKPLPEPSSATPSPPSKPLPTPPDVSQVLKSKLDELIALTESSLRQQIVMVRNLKEIKLNSRDGLI